MRKGGVFIDTFHWIAEINQRDEFHKRSVSARENCWEGVSSLQKRCCLSYWTFCQVLDR